MSLLKVVLTAAPVYSVMRLLIRFLQVGVFANAARIDPIGQVPSSPCLISSVRGEALERFQSTARARSMVLLFCVGSGIAKVLATALVALLLRSIFLNCNGSGIRAPSGPGTRPPKVPGLMPIGPGTLAPLYWIVMVLSVFSLVEVPSATRFWRIRSKMTSADSILMGSLRQAGPSH